MKKITALVLALVCVLGLVGCGQRAELQQGDNNMQYFFTAKVIEVDEEYLLLEVFDIGNTNLSDGVIVEVSTDIVATKGYPEFMVDECARVLLARNTEDNPAERLNALSIYKTDETGKVIEPTENNAQIGGTLADETFDIAVSYANWAEASEVYFGALNKDKMAISSVQHLPIYRFDTLEDLEEFKLTFGEVLAMDYGYDEVPSFNDITAKYDKTFFEENTLMLVYVGANSGTYRFGVNSVFCDGNSFCIHVEQINEPEVTTDDMAGWFITVAVPDSMVENCTEFDADLNNFN